VVADRLLHPPGFDSLIVSDFPPLFEEFHRKRFNLLWRAALTVSPLRNSTAVATAARIL
jgi:hypothetical protein